MWSFYWLGLWTEMRFCGLLADRQPTPAKVQAVSLHLTSAPRTRSRWAVIVDAGSCDCLHLYLKVHSDMLYNLECNIQVRHNHPYAWICKLFVFTCCLLSAEWTRFIWTQFTEHDSTKASPLPFGPVPAKIVLLSNQSDGVSVSHQRCRRGIKNLFGFRVWGMKLMTAQMIRANTRFFTLSSFQQDPE